MNPVLRQSVPARIVAVGFIVLILAGNAWLCFALLGTDVPQLVSMMFAVGVVTSVFGGIGLGGMAIYRRIIGSDVPDTGAGGDS